MGDESVSLTIERWFDAPPESVFAAWTDPAPLSHWFWPGHTYVEIEPEPGGAFVLVTQQPEAGLLAVTGVISEFVRPERLELTWQWLDEQGEPVGNPTGLTVAFAMESDGTLLQVTVGPFSTAEERDNNETGWNSCLDRLPAWLAA